MPENEGMPLIWQKKIYDKTKYCLKKKEVYSFLILVFYRTFLDIFRSNLKCKKNNRFGPVIINKQNKVKMEKLCLLFMIFFSLLHDLFHAALEHYSSKRFTDICFCAALFFQSFCCRFAAGFGIVVVLHREPDWSERQLSDTQTHSLEPFGLQRTQWLQGSQIITSPLPYTTASVRCSPNMVLCIMGKHAVLSVQRTLFQMFHGSFRWNFNNVSRGVLFREKSLNYFFLL